MIIDEENVSTETKVKNDSFVNSYFKNPVTSTPNTINVIESDDSFHSVIGEDDCEPLIVSMDTTEIKENKSFRKALGCIQNRLIETPKADMRRKLWRNMEDERLKKGVNFGHENTPPLPFKDITSSAPPKLYRHRKYT